MLCVLGAVKKKWRRSTTKEISKLAALTAMELFRALIGEAQGDRLAC
jgi:hypothetical protein